MQQLQIKVNSKGQKSHHDNNFDRRENNFHVFKNGTDSLWGGFDITYSEVSQVESRVDMIPVTVDSRGIQNCSIPEVNTRRTVPQKTRIVHSLGKENPRRIFKNYFHIDYLHILTLTKK